MNLRKCSGILIRTYDFGESDKIASFFTENGKVRVIAKGARRQKSGLASSLETLNYGHIVYFEKETTSLHRLDSFDVIERFMGIKNNLILFANASFAAEVVDVMSVESLTDEIGLSVLMKYMKLLPGARDPELLTYSFVLKFLAHGGFMPRLDRCSSCGADVGRHPWFNPRSGGIICRRCRMHTGGSQFKVTNGALATMRSLLHKDMAYINRLRIPDQVRKEIRRATISFTQSHTESELKTVRFIESMERERS